MKKTAKSPKGKSTSNKAKPTKVVKKAKGKSAPLSGGKKIIKKVKKEIVKKELSSKKNTKTIKGGSKKIAVKETKMLKKVSSPAKKILAKKTALPVKPVKAIEKNKNQIKAKIVEKPAEKKSLEKEKTLKPIKSNKEIVEKEKMTSPKGDLPIAVKKVYKRKKKKQKQDDDDEPTILEDILVEQMIRSTKRQPKVPKVPKILKTFVNPMTSLTVATQTTDKKGKADATPKKEPKGKFELEYVVRTSAGILYELLTTPSGLSEWFADDVNIRDGIFTFFWDGSEQKARLLGFKEDQYIRMQWFDKPEGSYFEFRIQKDELTGDVSLMITDFADEAADLKTSKLLWDSQVNTLLNVLGSN